MDLTKLHLRVIFTIGCVVLVGLVIITIVERYLGFLIPAWILAVAIFGCLFTDAYMRLSIWSKRDALFSSEELECIGTKVFFGVIIPEILFSVIGLITVLSEL